MGQLVREVCGPGAGVSGPAFCHEPCIRWGAGWTSGVAVELINPTALE